MALSQEATNRILDMVAPYTMVPRSAIAFTMQQMLAAIDAGLPGSIVECGVWKGGCSFALLLAQREAYGAIRQPVYLLDSFNGLPPAEQRDGPLALEWQSQALPELFFDNCTAEEVEVRQAAAAFGFTSEECRFVPGWFDQTVPPLARELTSTGISLLRLDGDWYSSTRVCLDHLLPLVAEGATVVVDDYYAWDGCARAIHDYFAENDQAYRLRSLPDYSCVFFYKTAFRKTFAA